MTTALASIVGVDLGGTKLLMIAGDDEDRSDTGPSFAPAELESRLAAFVARQALRPARIGIAVPGLVGADGRLVACDVLPAFAGWSPSSTLRSLVDRIAIVNDGAAALAEEMHDAPAGCTGGVVMVGTAVGAAFIVDGKPLLGARGWAGELGYLPLVVGDEVRRLDDLAGGAAIAAKRGVTASQLAQLARDGDAASLAAIAEAGNALGLGLAAVVNLFNPSRLAVGGGTLELPGYWAAARAAAARHSLPALHDACTLGRVRAGHKVVALGAMRCAAPC